MIKIFFFSKFSSLLFYLFYSILNVTRSSKTLNSSLRTIFQKLWLNLISEKEVDLLISDNVSFSMMRMDHMDVINLIYDFRGFLFLTELEVDQEMVRRGLRLGPACLSPGNDGRN